MTTPAPEVQDRRRTREAGRDFYATQGQPPPTLSPPVVQGISAGGPAATRAVDADLSKMFGAGLNPTLRPGQARTADTGDRRPGTGGSGPAAGKDTRNNGGLSQ
ncbi:hypothetical protein [Kribbella sp. NPDC004536]|uniref:hypothetical protein n=1 Tax=Kribbella sp. NPDC004536 TaxID=3364106 RepID=UPI0036BCE7C8